MPACLPLALLALTVLLLPSPATAQESVPFPATPSGSKAGPTIAESIYSPAKPTRHLPAGVPNVVIIMLDDVGPALPDTFGGPIHTPTMTRIASAVFSPSITCI